MSSGGRLRQGKTYTASAGKSPRSSVRSQVPVHQPEVKTASPEVSSSNKMRSPRTKFKNVDEPSPEKKTIHIVVFVCTIEQPNQNVRKMLLL